MERQKQGILFLLLVFAMYILMIIISVSLTKQPYSLLNLFQSLFVEFLVFGLSMILVFATVLFFDTKNFDLEKILFDKIDKTFNRKPGMITFKNLVARYFVVYLCYAIPLLLFLQAVSANFSNLSGTTALIIPGVFLALLFFFRAGTKEKNDVFVSETRSILISAVIIGTIYVFENGAIIFNSIPFLATSHLVLLTSLADFYLLKKK